MPSLPHWDVSNIYPSLESPEFQSAIDAFTAQLADLETYANAHQISRLPVGAPVPAGFSDGVAGYVDRINRALELYATLRSYLYSFISTDSYNALAKRRFSELQLLAVRLQNVDVRFQGWVGSLSAALPAALEAHPTLKAHAFYLNETATQSRYLMSEAEEALAADLNVTGAQAWGKLQNTVNSQLLVPFERNGQVEKLPIPALQNLQRDADAAVRRRAFEAELATWETVKEPLAAALNGIKGAASILNRRRGRTDALHASLDQTRIDRETLDAMLSAMRDSFPAFRRYMRGKAQRLGREGGLPWWDLNAPVGQAAHQYSLEEAQTLIVENFGRFSDRLATFTQRAFERNWLDLESRPGKQGGAFCMNVPGVKESRVLCNFDGSLDQVSTIAHELGHAFHNECLKTKTMLQMNTPMTLAETASIFCETIITEAALTKATDPQESLAILETSLMGSNAVIVDIYSRYLFETEVFERRAKAELSAADFCDIMLRAQAETYGDGIDQQYRHPYMWAWKPHYYNLGMAFYNYPYAFGLLFGTGLYAIYQQRGAAFVPDYENLLASTGEGTAADLAARFGINLRTPDFWRGSLAIIEKRIDQYLAL